MTPGYSTLTEFSICHIISEACYYQHFLGGKKRRKKKKILKTEFEDNYYFLNTVGNKKYFSFFLL